MLFGSPRVVREKVCSLFARWFNDVRPARIAQLVVQSRKGFRHSIGLAAHSISVRFIAFLDFCRCLPMIVLILC